MRYLKSVIFILILSCLSFAQFVNISVKVEAENLKQQEKRDLKILEGQIKSYLEDYSWIENKYNIALPLRISIYAQKATISSTERKFTGQIIVVTESNDLQLFEKKVYFYYSQNESLIHSDEIKSLATILDFYAYIMLAAEMDTYEPLGGSSLFEKARSIASRGEMSPTYATGWSDRQEQLEEIIDLRFFRQYKYYFWSIVDLESNGNLEQIPEAIDKALYFLDQELKINNRNRYMHLFIDAHAPDFADLLKLYGTDKQKEKILELDSDNRKIYEKAFGK